MSYININKKNYVTETLMIIVCIFTQSIETCRSINYTLLWYILLWY